MRAPTDNERKIKYEWYKYTEKWIAEGFEITVMSDDGVIEAIEHKTLPVFGVQWHPERMCFNAKREDTVDGSKVIEEFIKMCRKG